MNALTPTAGRFSRPAVVLLLVLFGALGLGPAQGAGTGGIEVSPYPGVVNGRQITAFHTTVPSRGSEKVRYSLRNTTQHPVKGRLYAARAVPDGRGGYAIGDPGSSAYLSFPTREVTLKGGELQIASFNVHAGPNGRPKGKTYGAIVVEVSSGSVVQRAATLVYLKPGRLVPLPLLIVLIAVGLLVLAGLGFLLVTVRRRRRAAV